MRRALFCLFAPIVCAPWVRADPYPFQELGIVLNFQGPHSPGSDAEMQRETEEILKESNLRLEWLLPREAVETPHSDLVVIQFKGTCVLDPGHLDREERASATLAFTYETDGVLQPFSEVACERVAASVLSALRPGDVARTDLLMGRALGRVLAHELVHILTGSEVHGQEGVGKPTLSGKDLIAATFPLSASDLARLRRVYRASSEVGVMDIWRGPGRAMRLR